MSSGIVADDKEEHQNAKIGEAAANKRKHVYVDDVSGSTETTAVAMTTTETKNTSTMVTTTTLNEKIPITKDGQMPQKKFYRARAHCNPLSHNDNFDYPIHPTQMDWSTHYTPTHTNNGNDNNKATATATATAAVPDVLDVGCGFGGLTMALSTLLPNNTILGLEIRAKVTEYVRLRIMAHRSNNGNNDDDDADGSSGNGNKGGCENASVMRSNTMKFMPNLFLPHSLEKIFFCFPDPHFKRKNHPRRIVSKTLLTEYAYFLKPNVGRLYCITDVEELHQWHIDKCNSHPLFRKLTQAECDTDPCVKAMYNETEEGKKVQRAGTNKYYAVYQRIPNTTAQVTAENFWNADQLGVSPILSSLSDNKTNNKTNIATTTTATATAPIKA